MDTKDLLNIYKIITKELVDNLNKKFEKIQDELVEKGLTKKNYLDYHVCCYNEHNKVVYEYTPIPNGSLELLYQDGYISIYLPNADLEYLLKYMSVHELYMFNTITTAIIDVYSGKSKSQTVIEL